MLGELPVNLDLFYSEIFAYAMLYMNDIVTRLDIDEVVYRRLRPYKREVFAAYPLPCDTPDRQYDRYGMVLDTLICDGVYAAYTFNLIRKELQPQRIFKGERIYRDRVTQARKITFFGDPLSGGITIIDEVG
jgi:hypothetical protein